MDRRKRSSNRIFALCLCICLGGGHCGGGRVRPGRCRVSGFATPESLGRCRFAAAHRGSDAGRRQPRPQRPLPHRRRARNLHQGPQGRVARVGDHQRRDHPRERARRRCPGEHDGTAKKSGSASRLSSRSATGPSAQRSLPGRRGPGHEGVPARRGATGMACIRERGLGCPAGPHRSYRGTLSHVATAARAWGPGSGWSARTPA